MRETRLRRLLYAGLLLTGVTTATNSFADLQIMISGGGNVTLPAISGNDPSSWSTSQSVQEPLSIYWNQITANDGIAVLFTVNNPVCNTPAGDDAVCMNNQSYSPTNNQLPYQITFQPCTDGASYTVTCENGTCPALNLSPNQAECGLVGNGHITVTRLGVNSLPNAGDFTSSVSIQAQGMVHGNINNGASFTVNENVGSDEGLSLSTEDVQFPDLNPSIDNSPDVSIAGHFSSNSATIPGLYIHVDSENIGNFEGSYSPYLSYTSPTGTVNKLYYTVDYNTPCGTGDNLLLTEASNYRGTGIGYETPISANNTFDCQSGNFIFTILTPASYHLPEPAAGTYSGSITMTIGST